MTDDATRAVLKLRSIQQDVERLKAARDDAGEIRLLRQLRDTAVGDDSVDVGAAATLTDAAVAADSVTTTVRTADAGDWDGGNWDGMDWG